MIGTIFLSKPTNLQCTHPLNFYLYLTSTLICSRYSYQAHETNIKYFYYKTHHSNIIKKLLEVILI